MFNGIFLIEKKMHTNASVPNNPLNSSNGLLKPHGLIFLFLIINDVINKLNIDLNSTNSYIGILLSIFFTHKVMILKKNEANIKFNFLK